MSDQSLKPPESTAIGLSFKAGEPPSNFVRKDWSQWVEMMLETPTDEVIELFDLDAAGSNCSSDDVKQAVEFLHRLEDNIKQLASQPDPEKTESQTEVEDVTPTPPPHNNAAATLKVVCSILRGADFMQIKEALYLEALMQMLTPEAIETLVTTTPPKEQEGVPILVSSVSAGQRLFDRLGAPTVAQLMLRRWVLVGHRGSIDGRGFTDELLAALHDPDLSSPIEELSIRENTVLTTVAPCAMSLKRLCAAGSTINDLGLAAATHIAVLDARSCPNVTTVAPFAHSLRVLYLYRSPMEDSGLSSAHQIEELSVIGCSKITTVKPFGSRLKILNAMRSGINDAGLTEATCIEQLNVTSQTEVTSVAPFAASLKQLHAGRSGINDAGLAAATSIVELDVSFCEGVTTVAPFEKTLLWLDARWTGIDDAGLAGATQLQFLNACNCPDITTIEPFRATLRNLYCSGSGLENY